ncbi:MAG: Xaa-Pro peptidase family protein [archaeon]|nr:Xaa-Pro peptidase family protein [archaeon]
MKLKEFQRELQKKEIDLVFLRHPDPNLTYFIQASCSYGFLVVSRSSASLYLTELDLPPKVKGINNFILKKGWEKQVGRKDVKKVGINKSALPLSSFESLKKLFPKARFVDVTAILTSLRSEKTEEEKKYLKIACDVTSNALNALSNNINKIKTEQSAAIFLESFIRENDCSVGFPTIAAMGKNAAIPHHITSSQKLRKGFLLLDFGACYKNYNADMTRVLYLGKPTKQEKSVYNILLDAQQSTIEMVAEGKEYLNLDEFCRKKLGKHAKSFNHSLGHGIGVELHEEPFYKKGSKISKNHAFTIEPGIYYPGKFGLRIEDSLIFDGKTRILTKASKELVTLNYS